MSGPRTPSQPFSAADSYAQLYDVAATSSATNAHHVPTERSQSTAGPSRSPSALLAERYRANEASSQAGKGFVGQKSDVHALAGTSAHLGTYSSQKYDEEDEEHDDDWDVYDDFNNYDRSAAVTSHLNVSPDVRRESTHSSPLLTPYRDNNAPKNHVAPGEYRQSTLLDSASFGFDVQNSDPRSSTFVPASMEFEKERKHRSMDSRLTLATPVTTPMYEKLEEGEEAGIELATVPGLGNEYTDAEKVQMTRKYRGQAKRSRKKEAAKRWGKGEYKICGWLSPRVAVFAAFAIVSCFAVMLYFVVPRVPSLSFNSTDPLVAVPNSSGMSTHYAPTNWSMTMDLALRGNNEGGWIPSYVSKMEAVVTEVTTSKKIGSGRLSDLSFPGRSQKTFSLPVQFAYSSLNVSGDATFLAVYDACQHQTSGGSARPNLNLAVEITMYIRGLVGGKVSSTRINTACPFELQWSQSI